MKNLIRVNNNYILISNEAIKDNDVCFNFDTNALDGILAIQQKNHKKVIATTTPIGNLPILSKEDIDKRLEEKEDRILEDLADDEAQIAFFGHKTIIFSEQEEINRMEDFKDGFQTGYKKSVLETDNKYSESQLLNAIENAFAARTFSTIDTYQKDLDFFKAEYMKAIKNRRQEYECEYNNPKMIVIEKYGVCEPQKQIEITRIL